MDGPTFRRKREENLVSLTTMARRLGVSKSTVCNWQLHGVPQGKVGAVEGALSGDGGVPVDVDAERGVLWALERFGVRAVVAVLVRRCGARDVLTAVAREV